MKTVMYKPDIHSGRLKVDEYRDNFADIHPPLSWHEARMASDRCLYCEAAPCITACPTHINVPSFIHRIATHNIDGAAQTILDANILGGSCARVCPTEILCEQACVRNKEPECLPVAIGLLQRFAIDNRSENHHPFTRKASTGKSVAVVGAGPAGLACAHRLSRFGHDVTLYDAKPHSGGLNEYGIAAYKLVEDYAQKEIEFVLGLGGIHPQYEKRLGKDMSLDTLRETFNAVFLAPGLGGSNSLGLSGEHCQGVEDAIKAIDRLRQTRQLNTLPVGRRVIVIGGGNTAIDIACQSKRLGADEVTLVYRRGAEDMSATDHEQAFARDNGIRIIHWARLSSIETVEGHLKAVTFTRTQINDNGLLKDTEEHFHLPADTLYKAIGQHLLEDCFAQCSEPPAIEAGRIATDMNFKTSLDNVWAGGDCILQGDNLTVQAVEHGKQAALAIDRFLNDERG
ncbi:NAD(P)-dependent oxidoreductase [Endozoicomonas montiporae]|nr:NAD(P)-dependent oxidoreductase [Endozoicomonas montiporae]